MPLIRYGIGDLVRAQTNKGETTYELHGRRLDSLTDQRGRRVTVRQIDTCFEGLPGFIHYQLIQLSKDRYRLRYIPEDSAVEPEVLNTLRTRLHALLATAKGLECEGLDALLGESSGKFRLCARLV